jgi:hypothetical protein
LGFNFGPARHGFESDDQDHRPHGHAADLSTNYSQDDDELIFKEAQKIQFGL